MTETAETESGTAMAEAFANAAHLDQALGSLERKLEILERKRREIMGVY